MFDFSDQVVMITGASGNLGRATTTVFYEAGAKLVLVDRDTGRLEFMVSDYDNPSPMLVKGDLMDAGNIEAIVHEVVEQLGQIDVLVNIAGGFRMGPAVHETPLDMWDFLMNLNAKSIMVTARAVVPHMLSKSSGKIVSISARAGLKGSPKAGAYTASKSAVIRLTEAMAAELGEQGINVNCILPGMIDTPQNREAMPNADFDKWVPPADLANAILFLCSPAARSINGVALPVTGTG